MTQLQPRHHTTHLIEEFGGLMAKMAVREPDVLQEIKDGQRVLRLYGAATKFILPDNGLLFDDTNLGRYIESLKLPFKEVVLEYDGSTGEYFGDSRRDISISLLAYETDESDHDDPFREMDDGTKEPVPTKGILVFVSYKPQGGAWMLMPAWLFIPEGTTMDDLKVGNRMGARVGMFMPATTASMLEGTPKEKSERLGKILLRESLALFQFCAAINCKNVVADEIAAPKFLNMKRQKKGKPPMFSYKVLTIDHRIRADGEAHGGTHASPRTHIRRGHVRHYKAGPGSRYKKDFTIWVEAMLVSRGAEGYIQKDYRVEKVR